MRGPTFSIGRFARGRGHFSVSKGGEGGGTHVRPTRGSGQTAARVLPLVLSAGAAEAESPITAGSASVGQVLKAEPISGAAMGVTSRLCEGRPRGEGSDVVRATVGEGRRKRAKAVRDCRGPISHRGRVPSKRALVSADAAALSVSDEISKNPR